MSKPAQGPDVALVRRAQAGDGEAFTQLFHQLHQPVLNYIYRTVGDRHVAEDITQDAFIRAHERVSQLGPPWDFKSWVFRIASNLAIDYLRQGKRFVDVEEPLDMGRPPTTQRPAERQVQRGEAREAVEATLVLMPTKYRQALVLREINGLAYGEVATALECKYDNARQLVHRARLNFRELHGIRLMAASGAAQCRELEELLSAFRDGELSAEDQRAVKRHIAACEYCQETEEDLKKVAAMVAGLVPIIPSPGWTEGVIEGLKSLNGPPATPGGSGVEGTGGGVGGGADGGGLGSAFKSLFSGGMWGKVVLAGAIGVAAGLATVGIVFGMMDVTFTPPGPDPLPVPYSTAGEPTSPPSTPSPGEGTAIPTDDGSSAGAESLALTIEPSPTLGPAIAIALGNSNCRYGPDNIYHIVGFLLKDERAPIDGRNAETTWWYTQRQDGPGHCWVANYLTDEEGDIASVPIVQAPPTPTPVDTEPPLVTISYEPTGSRRPNEDDVVIFSATASDDRSVAKIEIWIQAPGEKLPALVRTCSQSTCSYPGGPYMPGTGMYYAVAVDLVGNEGTSPENILRIHTVVR
ncbi:MAG: sigma-70 family RNA polymerase sigma factor [Chloroflexota bacterium]|nr:sigma-70 family RNA polymerase sigma factor [Chloroflexota bacterium]